MLFIFYILQSTVYSSTEIATRQSIKLRAGQLVNWTASDHSAKTRKRTHPSAPTTSGSHLNRCPPKCSTATRKASKWMLPTIGLQNPTRWSVASTNSRTLLQRWLAIVGYLPPETSLQDPDASGEAAPCRRLMRTTGP